MSRDYSVSELMACIMARDLRDGEVAVMGAVSMIPMAACRLAQLTHAPNLWYIAGGSGAVNPWLEPLEWSSCDYGNLRADGMLPLPDVILLEGHGRRLDVFFAGGIQIDRYGNCNLICVGDWHSPRFRGPGTVGLPFLPRAGRAVIYTAAHNTRTFVEKVDFVSGPGFLDGPESYAAQELPGKGPSLVVTPLCVMDFHPETRVMRLKALLPGSDVETVMQNTGFPLEVPPEVPVVEEPSEQEIAILRRIDPKGILRALG